MDDGKRKKKQNRFNSRVFKFSWPIETIAGNEYDIKFELWEINNVISYPFDLSIFPTYCKGEIYSKKFVWIIFF